MIGFIALCIIWTKDLAPALSPFYAIFEGMCIGSVSAFVEQRYPGMRHALRWTDLCDSGQHAWCLLHRFDQTYAELQIRHIFRHLRHRHSLRSRCFEMAMFLHAPMPFLHQGGWSALAVSTS